MRLLLIRPGIDTGKPWRALEAARAAALPDTEIVAATPTRGIATIDGYHDELLGAAAVAELVREHDGTFDAAVVGCFGDPGLNAARELTEAPVVGIAEASFMLAMTLGHRFSIITNLERGVPLLEDVVRHYGFDGRCSSIRATGMTVAATHDDIDAAFETFLPEAERAIREDYAEVICLACASLLGLRERMEEHLNVPVIEAVPAGVALAETLVRFGYQTSKVRAYKRPEPNVYVW
jgi:allantoin racemase